MEDRTWLSPDEVALQMGVAAATVRYWVRHGRVPARKVFGRWRIDKETVRGMLDE